MYFTEYVKYDGYCESLCSFKEGLGPILKCRVVSCSNGDYEIIIRDFATGKMVSSRRWKRTSETSKEMAKQQAIAFICDSMEPHLKSIKEVEVPFPECAKDCSTIGYFGVCECESFYPWKFERR